MYVQLFLFLIGGAAKCERPLTSHSQEHQSECESRHSEKDFLSNQNSSFLTFPRASSVGWRHQHLQANSHAAVLLNVLSHVIHTQGILYLFSCRFGVVSVTQHFPVPEDPTAEIMKQITAASVSVSTSDKLSDDHVSHGEVKAAGNKAPGTVLQNKMQTCAVWKPVHIYCIFSQSRVKDQFCHNTVSTDKLGLLSFSYPRW